MKHIFVSIASIALVLTFGCSRHVIRPEGDPKLQFPGEWRLSNIRQMTFGGTNAEAYWSFDGQWLSYQHKGFGQEPPFCDQIYRISVDGKVRSMVSSGKGRTTCSFYFPNDSRILYSTTHRPGAPETEACPPPPDMSQGYVWPIYDSFQMVSSTPEGKNTFQLEPGAPRAYNAEATVCKDGSVIFTSDRGGDLDLYVGKLDSLGTLNDIHQITNTLGYDGGAFFSQDCKKIVWRASRPRPGKEADEYKALLKKHLVKPSELEIWVADADGSHARQITRMNAASFAPYFTPDGEHVVFASNPRDPRGRKFDLYMVNVNGTGLERITYSDTFESFPMFSPDGKYIAFSSNRNAKQPRETNLFIADWNNGPNTHAGQADPLSAEATPSDRFLAIVSRLSAPEMEGRGVGTQGLARAETFAAQQFEKAGIKPFFDTFKKARKTSNAGYFQEVSIKIRSGKTEKTEKAHNVVGTIGAACGKTKPIVIGAHLDHLGYGGENSLTLDRKGIHPGADDNASGVAAILESARILEKDKKLLAKSCFIIAAFTGEEVGLGGSSRFAELLKSMGQLPKAMLNLDMVGRMEKNQLTVFGTESAPEWADLVREKCSDRRLTCPGGGDGYGPSDHMAFYIAKTPVLHFFTGPHSDYHRVSDTADKINATGGVQTAEVVADLAAAAALPKQKLTYQKAKGKPTMGAVGHHGRGNGAYLGTIPDYAALSSPNGPGGGGEASGGVRLAGARPGSPADKAGIREGDVLVTIEIPASEIEGHREPVTHKTQTLDDFMKALSDLHPGQNIILGVMRKGAPVKLSATVGKRDQQ